MSFYNECYRSFVPEIFIASMAYHAVVLLHTVRGPCSEAHALPAAAVACRPYPCQVGMTSSDSSSSIRIVPSPGSRGIGLGEPEVSSSGASLGPPSPVDARVLKDLEVMKAGHDLDTRVTEGSLAIIRERYSISTDRVSGAPSNNKGWKSHYLFVSDPNWGFRLDWSAHPIGNVPAYLSEEESVLVGRLKGILSSSCAIKEMTEIWLVEAGLNPTSTDRMDLRDLRGMPKISGGKTPLVRAAVPTREISISPARETSKTSSKRLTDASTERIDDLSRRHKKVKILSRRHKSRHGEEGSRSHSKGKELAALVEEPETLVESAEEDASLVFHHPRSMKDLCGTKVRKDDAGYYALYMSDLAHQDLDKEMQARWGKLTNSMKVCNDPSATEEFERGLLHPQLARELYTLPSEVLLVRAAKEMVLMTLFDRVHDAGRLITFMDYRITSLQQEIDALKSGGGPEAVSAAEEHASELEKELEKTKCERNEALQ
ncbi:hypothetical protein B296_00007037 [Ensete ventricosum]|uniref:Uncharacterized protein n=1 Tax=Ensete ventricosum TaxID=4639 RepID=A0A426YK72_ENSVE|nr:hypothetical protein B296_00007037 [Ensete ventricosum]